MNEMTIDEALSHVTLAETPEWLTDKRATIRFYDDTDGLRVRVAVRNGMAEPDDITSPSSRWQTPASEPSPSLSRQPGR